MRRKEREIGDRSLIDEIIRGAQVCRLGLSAAGKAYIVPLAFGYDGKALYFHTARTGLKIDMMTAAPYVCFEMERDVRLITGDEACDWTFFYESVIGYGTVQELTSPADKIYGLRQIMEHYSGRTEWRFSAAEIERSRVWQLTVESITGKRSS